MPANGKSVVQSAFDSEGYLQLYQEGCCQQGEEGVASFLLSIGEATAGVLGSHWEPQTYWGECNEWPLKHEGTQASLV